MSFVTRRSVTANHMDLLHLPARSMKGWVGVVAPHYDDVPMLNRERHERPLGVRPLTLRVHHVRVHVLSQPRPPLRHRCRTSVRLVSDVLLLLLLLLAEVGRWR